MLYRGTYLLYWLAVSLIAADAIYKEWNLNSSMTLLFIILAVSLGTVLVFGGFAVLFMVRITESPINTCKSQTLENVTTLLETKKKEE